MNYVRYMLTTLTALGINLAVIVKLRPTLLRWVLVNQWYMRVLAVVVLLMVATMTLIWFVGYVVF